MLRAPHFAKISLTALAWAGCFAPWSTASAAPGPGKTKATLLPPDAFSLAQPDKLATPREVQNAASPLKLLPPPPLAESEEAAPLAEPELAEPHSELLFPTNELQVLPPQPMGEPLLCIREDSAAELHLPTLAPKPHDDSGLAQQAADTLTESLGEPVWHDPELAATAAKASGSPVAPVRRDPRTLLNKSILEIEIDPNAQFLSGDDGEAMTPSEELLQEEISAPTLPELPAHDSADTSATEFFRR